MAVGIQPVAAKWALNSQLLCAIQNSDVMAAFKLFNAGVDTDTNFTISSTKRPALCISVTNNDIDMVRLMLRLGVSVNQCDSSLQTPLHIAFEHGYFSLSQHLLDAKANPRRKNSLGQTPLHLAAKRGNIEFVELLQNSGISLGEDEVDYQLQSPLHMAAHAGNPEVVQLLLREGSDPKLRDGSGDTPLHLAIQSIRDSVNTVRILMETYPEGALIPNVIKKTPLHTVITSTTQPEECLNVILSLIPIGENGPPSTLSPRGCFGHTPLHLSVLERKFTLTKMLIAAGAELDTRDQLGRTPLDCAIRDSCLEMVELLLVAGATCRGSYSEPLDPAISEVLREVRASPLSLAAHCRRSLTRCMGPFLQERLNEVPKPWRPFLSYRQL